MTSLRDPALVAVEIAVVEMDVAEMTVVEIDVVVDFPTTYRIANRYYQNSNVDEIDTDENLAL